jgi:2'-5' RNA ligase
VSVAQQGMLDGFELPAEQQEARPLFFALRPSAPVARSFSELVRRVKRDHAPSGTWLEPERFHITLQEVDVTAGPWASVVERARAVGAAFRGPAVEVCVDHALSFERSGRKPAFVLGCDDGGPQVVALQQALFRPLKAAGIGAVAKWHYTPHVTLGYHPQTLPRLDIQPIQWTCAELFLIKSMTGEGEHVVMGRWPLQQQAR